jgi:hypothetical protein
MLGDRIAIVLSPVNSYICKGYFRFPNNSRNVFKAIFT